MSQLQRLGWDDGMGLSRMTARQTELAKKKMCKIFKDNGLEITVKHKTMANQKTANFLDVTFDLNKGIYKPYAKPNNEHFYIHSNHPRPILRNISLAINKRLSKLSYN